MKLFTGLSMATLAAAMLVAVPSTRSLYAQDPWEAPPQELQGVAQRGYHDGVEGARRDFENHRPPDVNNRDEYRHPDVPHRDREAYRDGFRRGYDAGVQHLMGHGRY